MTVTAYYYYIIVHELQIKKYYTDCSITATEKLGLTSFKVGK